MAPLEPSSTCCRVAAQRAVNPGSLRLRTRRTLRTLRTRRTRLDSIRGCVRPAATTMSTRMNASLQPSGGSNSPNGSRQDPSPCPKLRRRSVGGGGIGGALALQPHHRSACVRVKRTCVSASSSGRRSSSNSVRRSTLRKTKVEVFLKFKISV